MAILFHQFPYLSDNYGVLVHDEGSGQTACVDAGDAEAVLGALKDTGWALSELWITHWHWDHTDGMDAVREATGCRVTGPGYAGGKALRYDRTVQGGDRFTFVGASVEVLHTPGHTMDMVNYLLPDQQVIFTGDTLFAMGCGRVFEGSHEDMYGSMEQLRALDPGVTVYGGHEYTQSNARFALSVDPDNKALISRAKEVEALRAAGVPTMPTTMAQEFATNPFLRYGDAGIRAELAMEAATDAEVFSEIRTRKDNF
ncbi:MAG: hydroxyacylglutathione hydrolase [Pseudomonadota bacterium]